MKTKEKAIELVDKFKGYHADCGGWITINSDDGAKLSALICVDEIINLGFIFFGDPNKENNLEYWQQVKTEIEKL